MTRTLLGPDGVSLVVIRALLLASMDYLAALVPACPATVKLLDTPDVPSFFAVLAVAGLAANPGPNADDAKFDCFCEPALYPS